MFNLLIPTVATLLDKLIPDPQAKAEAQIKTIGLGLEKYYQKYGEYPVENSEPNGSKCLYQALSGDGSNYISGVSSPTSSTGVAGSGGDVILDILSFTNLRNPDDEQRMVKLIDGDYALVDPFGNEYRYHARNPKYNQSYDLYSIMMDKSESNPKKWVRNW